MSQIDLPAVTAGTIAEALQFWAASTPDYPAFAFLNDSPEIVSSLSYSNLHQQACAIAATLQDMAGLGDRALLLYPPGLEFIPAFFGCLYAGIVPAPAYPPRFDRLAQDGPVLRAIVQNCQPAVALTSRDTAPFLTGASWGSTTTGPLRWVVTDDIDLSCAHRFRSPRLEEDTVALLQYTSGSTASPKGVMLNHRNLMYAVRRLRAAIGWPRPELGSGTGMNWMPLYHDFGLIGTVLYPVFEGKTCVMMSPLRFLQQPSLWLEAISRHRASVSAGPCFAYQWCLDRIPPEQRTKLDLSSWGLAGIGADTIQPHTMQQFAEAFAPTGFRAECYCPGYGLAEATLTVTGGWQTVPPRTLAVSASTLDGGQVTTVPAGSSATRELMSCGRPWLGTRVEIVHPETQRLCPAGTVGEIWVTGPSVAPGYWGRPEETQQIFRAYLQDTGEGPFLRTGDLGFLDKGELFVTGRIKDLIVLRGRNHFPEDLELTVQSVHPALRAGSGAAFESYQQGQPRLIVVQEVQRRFRDLDVAALVGSIRRAVSERHGLQVYEVHLLQQGSLPKTSSGKIQRHACRKGYEQGTLRRWKGTKV